MTGATNYAENLIAQWLANSGSPTRPTAFYVGLFTVTPTSDIGTGGTEVSGGSYARKVFTPGVTGSVMNPTADVVFVEATADWGTVNGFGIFDALASGNLLFFDDLTAPKSVGSGSVAEFAAADLTVSMD